MELSVVIPVYNVEQTLDRCVESVLLQNVVSMEIILVDDGSQDLCPWICDEWAKKDNRINVIHKQNGGPGSARNKGIDIAKGEYITFVDSDDYILPDTYSYLVSRMKVEHLDMIEYAVDQQDATRSFLNISDSCFDNPNDYWMTTKTWKHGYLCNKIFRRDIIGKDRLPHRFICEDLLFLPIPLRRCSRIATTRHGGYVYTANSEGLSKKTNIRSIWGTLYAEIKTAWMMKIMPWSKNGLNAYYYMCCRIYDIIRLCVGIKI